MSGGCYRCSGEKYPCPGRKCLPRWLIGQGFQGHNSLNIILINNNNMESALLLLFSGTEI